MWAVIAALVVVVFSAGTQQGMVVQADVLLQEMPRLDGLKIYFTEARREASRFERSDEGLSRFAGLLQQQGASLFTLEWRTGFPTDADLIIIAGPLESFNSDQTARLWAYMNNNGRVLILATASGRDDDGAPLGSRTGLMQLMWNDLGLRALDSVVVTERQTDATEEADTTAAGVVARFAVSPANFSSEHPITAALTDELHFFQSRALQVDSAPQPFSVTPLVFSDTDFYGESQYNRYLNEGIVEFNIGEDITRGSLPLAAALDDPRNNVRIVLLGDREFATNGNGFQVSPPNSAGFLYPGNVRFMLNAVTWLVERETVDLTFATPGPTVTPTITPSPTPTPTFTPGPSPTPTAAQ
jgi:hypothetical protein